MHLLEPEGVTGYGDKPNAIHLPFVDGLYIPFMVIMVIVDVLLLGRPHWVLLKEDFTSWLYKHIQAVIVIGIWQCVETLYPW